MEIDWKVVLKWLSVVGVVVAVLVWLLTPADKEFNRK